MGAEPGQTTFAPRNKHPFWVVVRRISFFLLLPRGSFLLLFPFPGGQLTPTIWLPHSFHSFSWLSWNEVWTSVRTAAFLELGYCTSTRHSVGLARAFLGTHNVRRSGSTYGHDKSRGHDVQRRPPPSRHGERYKCYFIKRCRENKSPHPHVSHLPVKRGA